MVTRVQFFAIEVSFLLWVYAELISRSHVIERESMIKCITKLRLRRINHDGFEPTRTVRGLQDILDLEEMMRMP